MDIKSVQAQLQKLGYKLDVDGIAGKQTTAAVKAFQKKSGLKADGIVGPDTLNKLFPQPVIDAGSKPFIISGTQLAQICPKLIGRRADILASLISKIFVSYGMKTVTQAEELLATIIEETGEFATYTENLNYSATALLNQWPNRFTKEQALKYGRTATQSADQWWIAELAYGGRYGNGKPGSGDGWKFRGGGAIQTTFKSNYTAYANYKKMDVEKAAELIHTTDEYAIDSACFFFAVQSNLIPLSEKDDFKAITKAVNGGYINWDTRVMYLDRVKQVLR